jgi:hypothetical protein
MTSSRCGGPQLFEDRGRGIGIGRRDDRAEGDGASPRARDRGEDCAAEEQRDHDLEDGHQRTL